MSVPLTVALTPVAVFTALIAAAIELTVVPRRERELLGAGVAGDFDGHVVAPLIAPPV